MPKFSDNLTYTSLNKFYTQKLGTLPLQFSKDVWLEFVRDLLVNPDIGLISVHNRQEVQDVGAAYQAWCRGAKPSSNVFSDIATMAVNSYDTLHNAQVRMAVIRNSSDLPAATPAMYALNAVILAAREGVDDAAASSPSHFLSLMSNAFPEPNVQIQRQFDHLRKLGTYIPKPVDLDF